MAKTNASTPLFHGPGPRPACLLITDPLDGHEAATDQVVRVVLKRSDAAQIWILVDEPGYVVQAGDRLTMQPSRYAIACSLGFDGGEYKIPVALDPGLHVIAAVATDAAGVALSLVDALMVRVIGGAR